MGMIAVSLFTMPLACASAQPRAVIELFTSQGCDSCPPADKLVGELAKDPTLITLSLAVDYWDYVGWKDTLALPGHGARHRAYSRARGDRNVFTPQVVVNGETQAMGANRADIDRAIIKSHNESTVLSVPVALAIKDGKLTVTASAGKPGERGDVWLCPIMRTVPVAVTRGENKGKTLTYHNVVRRWIKLGEWNGAAATWTLPVKEFRTPGIDEAVVLVQSGSAAAPGPMLAAAAVPLN
jgi:hypothetical protein